MASPAQTIDVAALLDETSWSVYQKLLTILAALAIIFDGFDIQILGFAIPSLIRDWHVARADFGPVLAIGFAGMASGGPVAGYFGDRFGRRIVLIGCILLFAVANADIDTGIAFAKARDQLRQIERSDRFEAADVDLARDDVVIGQRVLLDCQPARG